MSQPNEESMNVGESSMGVESSVLTLKEIKKNGFRFVIPSYQRPYVWSDDHVMQLFNDIKEACASKPKQQHYFIGTVLSSLVKTPSGEKIYELVDGQQRTTTLMLICIAFKHAGIVSDLSDLAVYRANEGDKFEPRLQFAIRDQVQHLFGAKAGLEDYREPSPEQVANSLYLKQITAALNVLSQAVGKLDELKESGSSTVGAADMGKYLYENVQWVNNVVPAQMDLNRMFATMNTAGIQLEQSDILKAKLLKHIKTASDKARYEAMWVACERMDNYFERNVRQIFLGTDWSAVEPEDLVNSAKFQLKAAGGESSYGQAGLNIAEIEKSVELKKTREDSESLKNKNKLDKDKDEEQTVSCRSIIRFPLLLIHAYRIYLSNKGHSDIQPRLHSDRLLETFALLIDGTEILDIETKATVSRVIGSESLDVEVKEFIEVLWQVRYLFDRWVVKWVKRDDESSETQLGLTNPSKGSEGNNYYISRTNAARTAIELLQSVRNFTGNRSAQYWLSPFLAGLLEALKEQGDWEKVPELAVSAQTLLENIDNEMSLSSREVTQKVASFTLITKPKTADISWESQANYFSDSLGTGFEHYWFQKLEYLLWKRLNEDSSELNADEIKKFKKFRITSKNSVEHVFPQNEKYKTKLDNDPKAANESLNSFGNLVLLSPGENSSYSNQALVNKSADFRSKPHFDSLKLREIFELYRERGEHWGKQEIGDHQTKMLEIYADHYGRFKCDVIVS